MRDFDDELRDRLGRTAGDAPRPDEIPDIVLRRARRRRAASAALTGMLAVGLAFGAFVGVRTAMEAARPVAEQRPADTGPAPGPTPTPSPSPTPAADPAPASPEPEPKPTDLLCGDTEGGNWDTPGHLVDVIWERQPGVEGEPEAVTFRFEPMTAEPDPPKYFIAFTDQLVTDGEGAPVEVRGRVFVAVTFFATGVELSGEEIIEIYTGPKEILTEGPIVLELEQTGDFEGMGSWGIGLSEEACYTVDAGPDHLTITFFR